MHKYLIWIFSTISTLVLLKINKKKKITIDRSKIGLNAFYNDPRQGSLDFQSKEISKNLGIKTVRILFHWDEFNNKAEHENINWGFIDGILNSFHDDMKALIVVEGLPRWLKEYPGDKHEAFVNMFRKMCHKYKSDNRVLGYQIWNEPNMEAHEDNVVMGFVKSPLKYLRLLGSCYESSKTINPNKKILNAATTSISQNYPETLNYNRILIKNRVCDVVDIFAVHWYGNKLEKLHRPNGIIETLNGVNKPIWMTESGKSGQKGQKEYVKTVWPYLFKKIPNLQIIFYYIYYECENSPINFGLKYINSKNKLILSDLFSEWFISDEEKE